MKYGKMRIKSRGLGFLLGMAVAGAFLLAACQNINDPLPKGGGGYGRVSVVAELETARTVLPDTDMEINFDQKQYLFYKDAVSPTTNLEDYTLDADGYFILPATPNTGTLGANGYIVVVNAFSVPIRSKDNPDGIDPNDPAMIAAYRVAKGQSVLFKVGSGLAPTVINVPLYPTNDGEGFFKYDFDIDPELTGLEMVVYLESYSSAGLTPIAFPPLDQKALNPTLPDNRSPADGWKLPAGSYLFSFRIYTTSAPYQYWGVSEAVHIGRDLTTTFPERLSVIKATDMVEIGLDDAVRILKDGIFSWVDIPGLLPFRREADTTVMSAAAAAEGDFAGTVTLYFVASRLGTNLTTFPLTPRAGWTAGSLTFPDLVSVQNRTTFTYTKGGQTRKFDVVLQPVAMYNIKFHNDLQNTSTGSLEFPIGSLYVAGPTATNVQANSAVDLYQYSRNFNASSTADLFDVNDYDSRFKGTFIRYGFVGSTFAFRVPANTDLTFDDLLVADGLYTTNADGTGANRVEGAGTTDGTGSVFYYRFTPTSTEYRIGIHTHRASQIAFALTGLQAAIPKWIDYDTPVGDPLSVIKEAIPVAGANPTTYDLYYVHSRLGPFGTVQGFPMSASKMETVADSGRGWSLVEGSWNVDGTKIVDTAKVRFTTTTRNYSSNYTIRLNPVAEFVFEPGDDKVLSQTEAAKTGATVDRDITLAGAIFDDPAAVTLTGTTGDPLQYTGTTTGFDTSDSPFTAMITLNNDATPVYPTTQITAGGALVVIEAGGEDLELTPIAPATTNPTANNVLTQSAEYVYTLRGGATDPQIKSQVYKIKFYKSDIEQRDDARDVIARLPHQNWLDATNDTPRLVTVAQVKKTPLDVDDTGDPTKATRRSDIHYVDQAKGLPVFSRAPMPTDGTEKAFPNTDNPTWEIGKYKFTLGAKGTPAGEYARGIIDYKPIGGLFLNDRAAADDDKIFYTIRTVPVIEYSVRFSTSASPTTYLISIDNGVGTPETTWNGNGYPIPPVSTVTMVGERIGWTYFGAATADNAGTARVNIAASGVFTLAKETDGIVLKELPWNIPTPPTPVPNAVSLSALNSDRYVITVYPTVNIQRASAAQTIKGIKFDDTPFVVLPNGSRPTFTVDPVVPVSPNIDVYFYGAVPTFTLSSELKRWSKATAEPAIYDGQWDDPVKTGTAPAPENYAIWFRAIGQDKTYLLDDWNTIRFNQSVQFIAVPGQAGVEKSRTIGLMAGNLNIKVGSVPDNKIIEMLAVDKRVRSTTLTGDTVVESDENAFTVDDGTGPKNSVYNPLTKKYSATITGTRSQEYVIAWYPKIDFQREAFVTGFSSVDGDSGIPGAATSGIKAFVTDSRLTNYTTQPAYTVDTNGAADGAEQKLYYRRYGALGPTTGTNFAIATPRGWTRNGSLTPGATDNDVTPISFTTNLQGVEMPAGSLVPFEIKLKMIPAAEFEVVLAYGLPTFPGGSLTVGIKNEANGVNKTLISNGGFVAVPLTAEGGAATLISPSEIGVWTKIVDKTSNPEIIIADVKNSYSFTNPTSLISG